MISALNKLADGTIELTITIPTSRVKAAYQKTLMQLAGKAEIKGFRKGKAPLKLVEEKIGQQTLNEEVLKALIPEVYLEAVKEHQLKPVMSPQVQVTPLTENKDWQVKAITCELPPVKLDKYKDEVKKALATTKIWVPGKDKKEPKISEEEKLAKVFQALLKSCPVFLPKILTDEEVNRMLSRLLDQTNKLGLTVEQYLASAGKTSEQLRTEYRQQAEQTLKLELILAAIADDQKIEIPEAEVEKFLQAIPDEATRKSFDNHQQHLYLKQLLRKRQVIDSLGKL